MGTHTKAKAMALLEGDSAPEGEGIRVNAAFARAFEAKKRKEELSALERRRAAFGAEDESDESESETEDEDGEELTPALDADIRQTLRLIRRRDPAIYDPSVAFFKPAEGEEGGPQSAPKTKKDAPLYYKDLVRRQAEAGDVASGDESEDEKEGETDVLTFQEEQARLKREFLASVNHGEEAGGDEEDEEEGEGGLFKVRSKSAGEQEAEDAEMAAFTSKYGSKLAKAEVDPEAFLEHYLSSEGWKDKSAAVPHYEDIVQEDEEDAEALEQAESFEHAYNFRFEEEGGAVIQTHARSVEDSMRRVDDARRRKREERKARKALERQKKEEELRRLKNLKQAEIQAKLDRVARLMGAKEAAAGEEGARLAALASDLDADFDPDTYDEKMQALFDDEYYQEGEDADAVEKPTWDDEEDKALFAGLPVDSEDEEEDKDGEKKTKEKYEEEEGGDGEEEQEEEEEEGGRVAEEEDEALETMTVEEMQRAKQKYLDELYSLDYEDLIGDLKCRFKYRQVRDNDFGLTVDEIMAADDKELKQLVSLKRLAPYVEEEFRVDRKRLKRLRKSLEQERREKQEAQQAKAERRRATAAEEAEKQAGEKPKKKRKRGKKTEATTTEKKAEETETEKEVESKKKRKRAKKSAKGAAKSALAATGLSSSRLESYKLLKSTS